MKNKALPKGYSAIIGKCIELEPADRYQSIQELKADFLILTGEQEKFEKPIQQAEALLIKIIDTPSRENVTELDAIFAAHDDDELLYTKVFPKLRNGAVRPYHKFVKDRFYERVSVFDAFVEGSSLPFDYTDEVADLYEKIFDLTDDAAIKKLLLARVLSMAASYNRYHVGDVLGGMLEAIDSPDDALIARDVLRNDISSSNWFAEYKSGLDAVPVISETLAWCKEQQKKRETDEF